MAGVKKVLNQAYRRLSGVLDLPGSDFLGHIDTDQAVAVHPLDVITQPERCYLVQWNHVQTGAGAGVINNSIGFRDADIAAWGIRRWKIGTTGTGETISIFGTSSGINLPADWDYWILHVGFTAISGVGIPPSVAAYEVVSHGVTVATLPITNILNRVDLTTAAGLQDPLYMPAAGTPYYARPMPYHWHPQRNVFSQRIEFGGAGEQVETVVNGLMAPPGVLPFSMAGS